MQTKVKAPEKKIFCIKPYVNLIEDVNKKIGIGYSIQDLTLKNIIGCTDDNNCNDVNQGKTCDEIMGILKRQNRDSLKKFATYNLSELVKTTIDFKKVPSKLPTFSSLQWWYENVWGDNKFTNYLYVISASIAFLMFIYLTFTFLNDVLTKMNTKKYTSVQIQATLAITAIVVLVFFGLLVATLSREGEAERKGDTLSRGEYEKYKKVLDWTGSIGGIIGFIGLICALVVAWNNNNKIAGLVSIICLMPMIIIFNFYFSFYLPYLLIIGIILQKVLMDYNKEYYVLGGITGSIIILSIVFLIVSVSKGSNDVSYYDECTGTMRKSSKIGNKIMPFMFFIFTFILVVSVTIFMKKKTITDLGKNNMNLYLGPIVNLVVETI